MICKCDLKRKVLVGVVLAVAYATMDFLFHHIFLGATYMATASLWRAPAESAPLMKYGYLGYLLFGFVFYCVYGFGHESGKTGWSQGLRYGLMIGLIVWGAGNLIMIPFAPYAPSLVFNWFLIGMVEYAVLGAITGLLHKPRTG